MNPICKKCTKTIGLDCKCKLLSQSARQLLHALIHGSNKNWWEVIQDSTERQNGMNELLAQKLIEVDTQKRMTRATHDGIISNRKAIAAKLVNYLERY